MIGTWLVQPLITPLSSRKKGTIRPKPRKPISQPKSVNSSSQERMADSEPRLR